MFRNLKTTKTLLYTSLLASPMFVSAKSLTLVPVIELDNVLVAHKQTNMGVTSTAPNIDTVINVNTLNFGAGANWESRKADIKALINTEFIHRSHISGTPEEDLDAFLQLNATANFNLWQDKLFLTTELGRTQQATTQQVNVDNKLIGGSRWFNVNDGRIALNFRSKVTPYANLTTEVSATKTQADSNAISTFNEARRINTETTSGSIQLDNLDKLQPLSWSFSSSYGSTGRAQLNNVDTGAIRLFSSFNLTQHFAITGSAEQSITQIDGNSSLSQDLEFKQVGLGVKWETVKESEFEVTINNASSERNSNEVYVGGNLVLNLSQFSQLQYEKRKNALGQSDTFSLSLQGRQFNLGLNYQTSIDINVRQGFAISSPESFICPFGSQDLSDCIINTSQNTVNNNDFFETTFSPRTFELNEQLVDNESLVFKLGYDNKRQVKLSLTAQRSKLIGLESTARNSDVFSIEGLIQYRLNSRSELTIRASTNATEFFTLNQLDEQTLIDINYSQRLGRKTQWQAFIKQTDISSEQRGYEIDEVQLGASINFDLD